MIISISGKMQSGKDTVGKILQYLFTESNPDFQEFKEKYFNNKVNVENTQFEIKKFADKLKDIVCLLIGCTRTQLEDSNFKEKELGEEWGVWKVIRKDGTQFGRIHENKKDAEFALSICSWPNCQVVFEKMTPRKMLQQVGTDLFRNQLHVNTWVNATFADYKVEGTISIAKSINNIQEVNIDLSNKKHRNLIQGEEIHKNISLIPNWIITDTRFPNELEVVKQHDGLTIKVHRYKIGDSVKWTDPSGEISGIYNIIQCFDNHCLLDQTPTGLQALYSEITLIQTNAHQSETALDKKTFDYIIENSTNLENLYNQVYHIYKINYAIN